jgi:hypothetical protein
MPSLEKIPILNNLAPLASLGLKHDVIYLVGLLVSTYIVVSLAINGWNLLQWFIRGGIDVKKLGKYAGLSPPKTGPMLTANGRHQQFSF